MIRRILGDLPAWARPDHPLLRYELFRQKSRATRIMRLSIAAGQVFLLFALLTGGLMYATEMFTQPAGINITQSIWRILYFPTLFVQVMLSVIVLAVATGSVSDERRRQTWDNLRATETGAEMILRTRWVALFFRVRLLIGLVIVARLVLSIAALYELTSFRGNYLDLLTAGIIPEVSLPVSITLVAATMTAAFILPLTQTGIEIALSLLIAAAIHNRTTAAVLQILLIAFKLMLVYFLTAGATAFLQGQLLLPDDIAWFFMATFSALGDNGLVLMQVSEAGQIWAIIPYGIFLGAALLLFALIQAVLTDAIMACAVRRAERTG